MLNAYDHPILAWMMDHMSAVIVVSGLLLVVAVLALVTRWWNRKDEAACRTTYQRVDRSGASSTS